MTLLAVSPSRDDEPSGGNPDQSGVLVGCGDAETDGETAGVTAFVFAGFDAAMFSFAEVVREVSSVFVVCDDVRFVCFERDDGGDESDSVAHAAANTTAHRAKFVTFERACAALFIIRVYILSTTGATKLFVAFSSVTQWSPASRSRAVCATSSARVVVSASAVRCPILRRGRASRLP